MSLLAQPDILPPARLELEDVSVSYGGHLVLRNITFDVPSGARVAVVGPNGAGKSTLFKALVGLLPVTSGKVSIHGRSPGSHLCCVAYVPQREEVDWRFPVTVEDVVMMGRYGRLKRLQRPGQADRAAVDRSLEQMGLTRYVHRPIGELSGGQQQRVFLARALAQEPHILLLDEPFTGVDVATQEVTLALLDSLKAEGVTVLVSTHDLNMAAERFERVLVLNHTLISYGPPAEAFTPQAITGAFGGHVLRLEGSVVVDQCCPPEEHEHTHGHEPERGEAE